MGNARIDRLTEFPFRRLAALLDGVAPGAEPIDLSIGEPRHAPPPLLAETVAAHAGDWSRYPPPQGTTAFREAAAAWCQRRFDLPERMVDPAHHVLPLAGTKEGLFLLPQLVTEGGGQPAPVILMPDPVYATYSGATVMAGAEPVYLPATAATGFLPDLDAIPAGALARCVLFFLCTPANPQGAAASAAYLDRALALARAHGFVLVVDECYGELWDRAPPPGGLEAAARAGGSLANLVVLHSLSKRSSAAGLRSGFAVGDAVLLARFLRLRAYGAAVQPLPLMAAATALWADDGHVAENRDRYRCKLDAAERVLGSRAGFARPAGGFFLWLDVGAEGGEAVAKHWWQRSGLKVLPGAYLSADPASGPGHAYVRVAMVDPLPIVERALERMCEVLQ